MSWFGEHRAYALESFFKNNESVIATQRAFRTHFHIPNNEKVPDRKTIVAWVSKFRQTGSLLKTKPPGRNRTARTPENIQAVMESVMRSPSRSARKHASALGLSDTTVRRILNGRKRGSTESSHDKMKSEVSSDNEIMSEVSSDDEITRFPSPQQIFITEEGRIIKEEPLDIAEGIDSTNPIRTGYNIKEETNDETQENYGRSYGDYQDEIDVTETKFTVPPHS